MRINVEVPKMALLANPSTKAGLQNAAKNDKGCEQEDDVDRWTAFSPIPRITIFRVLTALAAHYEWNNCVLGF